MHFKLDLKEKKTLMKKAKSGETGTFFEIQTFILPFFVVLENRTLLSEAFMDGGWKSASERPIWSAFNGWEGKSEGRGGKPIFLPPVGQSCFWNFISGIIQGADLFYFL